MKKTKIILATRNPGKIREIKKIMRSVPVQILALSDKEFKNRKVPRLVENGKTFEENALKKAYRLAQWAKLPALADDSGLQIKVLDGLPGIKSARFAGPGASDKKLCQKVLRLMAGRPKSERAARFVCLAALVFPDGRSYARTGYCRGYISEKMAGQNGFGYDPIFYYPPLKKNFAELSLRNKNQVSHRSQAFRKMAVLLKKLTKT